MSFWAVTTPWLIVFNWDLFPLLGCFSLFIFSSTFGDGQLGEKAINVLPISPHDHMAITFFLQIILALLSWVVKGRSWSFCFSFDSLAQPLLPSQPSMTQRTRAVASFSSASPASEICLTASQPPGALLFFNLPPLGILLCMISSISHNPGCKTFIYLICESLSII